MPEQFVGAIHQVDFQDAAPTQTYRRSAVSINWPQLSDAPKASFLRQVLSLAVNAREHDGITYRLYGYALKSIPAFAWACSRSKLMQQLRWDGDEAAFCCPDFRVMNCALCVAPPATLRRLPKLIRGGWFAKVVVMSERVMSECSPEQIRELLDSLYRVDSGRILATLIRLLGDFDLAEEAMHEAFAAALSLWPRSGVPGNPRPWLISTARFKAIDTLRRRARFDASQDELARHLEAQSSSAERSNAEDSLEDDFLEDDRLRLIFTCCHPSLAPEARVALTLREVCGLTTEEIAKAFLTTPRTLAQRIVRAKAKIRETPIPYEVPTPQELPERLGAVLHVIYLVFNEGYSAAAGAEVTRAELTGEAIRLGRLLARTPARAGRPEMWAQK